MNTFIIVLVFLSLTSLASGLNVTTCFFDSDCMSAEFCDKDTFSLSLSGKCKQGETEGSFCIRDRVCESKECSFFKCKKRIALKNGPCKRSADCPNDQFCDDLPGRSDLRMCFDKKCAGTTCRKDSQCVSNNCQLLKCAKGNGC